MNVRKVPVIAVAGLTVAALLTAAPASAAVTGTVKVRTQRTSAPSLASQVGWYESGTKVTLSCSSHGQPVKGFFSFNIPGGWDDLWYRTSDGSFVADVDIETGTLNSVTPDCGAAPAPAPSAAPAAAPQGSREDRAVAWANGQVGSDSYDHLCGRFVANAYGKPNLGAASAQIFHDQLAGSGQIHMDRNYPKGALVFSASNWDVYKGVHQGHVVLSRGDGSFVSGGVSTSFGSGHTVQILRSWNPSPGAQYLGWASAPAGWQGP
jgi:hypothetical protein